MLSSFWLWVIVAALGGLNENGLRFPLGKGFSVRIAPESQQYRAPVTPSLGIGPNGRVYSLYESVREITFPVFGLFKGNPNGAPEEIGVRFLDESRTGLLAIVAGLWRFKQLSNAGWVMERTSYGWLTYWGGPPNAVICLYSQTLELWRSAADHRKP